MTLDELHEVAWLRSARREPFDPQLLRQRRKEAHLSAAAIATVLDCRQREVERWESGDRKLREPRLQMVERMMAALGADEAA